jgi:cellobiose-specific phosphotransferase system component IIC
MHLGPLPIYGIFPARFYPLASNFAKRKSMRSLTISMIAFMCVFGGALLGVLLRVTLPKPHSSPESRDVVKLGVGTIATMSAIVLGLLVASAKGYYDTQSRELTEMSARVVLLDRMLAHYANSPEPAISI